MSTARKVFSQLQDDFPSHDAKWALNSDVKWSGAHEVPLAKIDFANEKNWNAYEHTAKLKKFEQKIKAGDRKPVILGKVDGGKLKVLDGHHRVLAHQHLNLPVRAYIANIGHKSKEAALEMHAAQRKGDSGPMKDRSQKFSNTAEFTAQTGVASTVHHPFGSPSGPGLWHMKGKELPAYIQNVAHALIRSGSATGESDAIHKAVGIVQGWAAGHASKGKKVSPTVQAAAARAVAQWEALRGERAAKSMSNEHDAIELAGTIQPKQERNQLTALDFHKIPSAMRRVKKYYKSQGLPDDQATAKTLQFFKQLKSSPNPILSEASQKNIQSYKKRKTWAAKGISGRYTRNLVHGKKKNEAGGDTGFSYKQYHLANDHHDGDGKFAKLTKERERILKTFQDQHNLTVSGTMDSETREYLQTMNKAAND